MVTKTHIRVDECYYYDSVRNCIGNDYKIETDSTILVNGVRWKYQPKKNGEFLVSRLLKEYTIYGQIDSLPVFQKTGTFIAISNNNDTLWFEDYQNDKLNSFKLPIRKINGKIYSKESVTKIPLLNGNDTLPKISIKHIPAFCCEDNWHYASLILIINKTGEIVNIQSSANNNEMKEISLILSKIKNISPAIRKGKPVNFEYWLPLELK